MKIMHINMTSHGFLDAYVEQTLTLIARKGSLSWRKTDFQNDSEKSISL